MFPKLPFKGNTLPFIENLLPKWYLGDKNRPEMLLNDLTSWERGTTWNFWKNNSPLTFALSVELLEGNFWANESFDQMLKGYPWERERCREAGDDWCLHTAINWQPWTQEQGRNFLKRYLLKRRTQFFFTPFVIGGFKKFEMRKLLSVFQYEDRDKLMNKKVWNTICSTK